MEKGSLHNGISQRLILFQLLNVRIFNGKKNKNLRGICPFYLEGVRHLEITF